MSLQWLLVTVVLLAQKIDLFVKFDKMNYEPIIENVIRLHLSK